MITYLITNAAIISSDGLKTGNLIVEKGIINFIKGKDPLPDVDKKIDAEGLLLFPGLIDCHVHFREPGYEQKGDMQTESRSALAGGVTTVCEMPNTNPPTVSIAALEHKVNIALKIKDCDIRFFFGVTERDHINQLSSIWQHEEHAHLKSKCCGVKVYFDNSTGNQKANEDTVEKLFEMAAKLNIPVVAHCEDTETNKLAAASVKSKNIQDHSAIRPRESEIKAIEKAINLGRKHSTNFHVAHLSTKEGLNLIRSAKKEKLSVTCEVSPHHLFLNENDYEKLGTFGKMNPPLREVQDCIALWEGISDGTVDCIATDHAPHTLEEKKSNDPLYAPSGVPGVETLLPLLLSAASKNQISYEKILELCFTNPNKIFNLKKEDIYDGSKADIVLVDPNKNWIIRGKNLHAKCGWTPYEEMRCTGKINTVISNGEVFTC